MTRTDADIHKKDLAEHLTLLKTGTFASAVSNILISNDGYPQGSTMATLQAGKMPGRERAESLIEVSAPVPVTATVSRSSGGT